MIDTDYFQFAEEKFCEMTDFLRDKQSRHLELSDLENYLSQDGRELLRRMLIEHFSARGVGDIGLNVIGTDGIDRTHKRIRTWTIKTILGDIEIKRLGYFARNASSLFPLDAMLNLPIINISYILQKNLVLESVKSSFNESVLSVKRWTGVNIPKRQARKVIIDAAKDFETFYDRKKRDEKQTAIKRPLMILTSDGKGVMMRHEDLRFAPKKRAENKKTDEDNFKLTGNRNFNSKRMATVASVYEIDRFIREPKDIHDEFFNNVPKKETSKRPSPKAKRVWAGLENSGEYIIRGMFEEALKRSGSDKKEWVVLVDGDPNQIKIIKKFAQKFDKKLTIICDIIHILEYVWNAGKVLNNADNVREWVSEKFYSILKGRGNFVAAGMRRSATGRFLTKSVREPVDSCAK